MYSAGSYRETSLRPSWAVIEAALAMLLFVGPAYGLNPDRTIFQYAHSAWRSQDGFIGAEPLGITQTTDGYIWIATTSGILRFDGTRFVSWFPPSVKELRTISVYSILGTSDGSLWFATDRAGLWQWKNLRLTKYVLPGNEPVGAILEKEPGKVWFGRSFPQNDSSPLCEAGDDKLQCYGLPKQVGGRCCFALAKGRNGDLWLGGKDLIKWHLGSSAPEVVEIGPAIRNMVLTQSIAALPDGSVWIGVEAPGTLGGLQHYGSGGWSHFHSSTWDSSSIGVTSVLSDSHGALWVGSINQGLYRIWNGKVDHFGSQDGLSGDRIQNLLEDHEGNLWVTTIEGLDCFRDLAVTAYSKHEGLRVVEFDTVLATRDGTLWTGGDSSLDQLREGRVVSSLNGKDLPGGQVTSMLEDSQGRVWVGIDHTLSIFQNKRFTQIMSPDGRSLGMVAGMAEDRKGAIWAEVSGTPRKLVEIKNAKVIQMFSSPEMPAARKIAFGNHGDMWLGLVDGGLARYQQGKLDVFRFSDKRESWVNEVGVESDNTVLGATGYGLIGWRDGKQRVLNTHNGLPCKGIMTFIRDYQRALWLFTQCGLIRISKDEVEKWWNDPDAILKMRLFDAADGAQFGIAPFQTAARSPDGRLWFVNQANLLMIDPSNLLANGVSPPVHVEELIVAGRSYPPQTPQHLAPSTRSISIRYTALSYMAPQKVFFRYMLEGQDSAWQDVGTRREAFYTNLGPGAYRFHVIACNNDGLWNQVGDSYSFDITPAYYQTRWFEVVCVLVFVGMSWALYLLRLRQITLQIHGRLGARMEERERIARELHDTLLQGFQGLMLRFQAVMKTLPADQLAHQTMAKVLDRADEVLFEGRQSVRDLREMGSSGAELSDTLLHCGEELALGHSCRFSAAVIGDPRSIEPMVFEEAYRIAREALINAFQHAMATQIEAEITFRASGISIRIRDDGIGIEAGIVTKGRVGHWGLSGIRERAHKMGAKVSIWSSPGTGTEVDLSIPAKVAYAGANPQAFWQPIKRMLRRDEETRQ